MMKKQFLLSSLGLAACCTANAQMPKWFNPPVVFDWATHTQTMTVPIDPSVDPEIYGSNAVYNVNGQPVMCAFGAWAYRIFNGAVDGPISAALNSLDNAEINFIKIPNTCADYYILYANYKAGGATAYVRYSRLINQPQAQSWYDWPYQRRIDLAPITGTGWCNFAVSKQFPNKNRYLFISGNNGLAKFLISNEGISYVSTVADASSVGSYILRGGEGELYENGSGYKYLTGGFASAGEEKIGVINMDANGNYVSRQNYGGVGKVQGIEFVDNNRVLFSSNLGIGLLTLSTGVISYLSNTANCRSSHIEKAIDGKFYTIGTDGANRKLVELNINTLAAIYTTYLYNSRIISPTGVGHYALVDQVDNEDYLQAEYKADLVIKDEPNDIGIEPTAAGLLTTEGDIWNCHDENCTGNQNPRSTEIDTMRVTVTNRGCRASQPAQLHMHWTRARSGEWWANHWYDQSIFPPNNINGYPAGGEITVQPGTAISDPVTVPSLQPGQSITLSKEWQVPDRTWYPLNGGGNDGVNPMICFLARVTSAEDPIINQQTNVVVNDYVKNNNNVATRNSFILPTEGGRPGRFDGSLQIYNPEETRQVVGIRVRGVNTIGVDHLRSVDIVMESALYARWVQNGRKGIGIADIGNNTVRITDYNLAEISGIDINYLEGFNIAPSVMLDVNNQPAGDLRMYSFVVDHFYADRSTGSPSIYHVDYHITAVPRLAGAGNKAEGLQPVLSPNPTTGVLHITYPGMSEKATITLYDNLGRKVQQQALSGTNSTVNIERLPAGLYFYRIDNGREQFEGKIVKE